MHAATQDGGGPADAIRITLRPLGSALPLGFFVFGTGMAVLGGIQLQFIPLGMERQAAVLLLTFVAPWPGRAHISLSRHLVLGG